MSAAAFSLFRSSAGSFRFISTLSAEPDCSLLSREHLLQARTPEKGLADLRLALPVALIASIGAIIGALIGLALPTHVVQIALGATILGIVAIMSLAKKSEYPEVKQPDNLSQALRIRGYTMKYRRT